MLETVDQTNSVGVLGYSAKTPSSGHAPPCTNPETRSPTLRLVTFLPTLTTVPEKSHLRTLPRLPIWILNPVNVCRVWE